MGTFNGLKENSKGLIDVELFDGDFYREKDDSIKINPVTFEKATSRIKLGTALKYDKQSDIIDTTPMPPLSANNGTIALQYGTGLYMQEGKLCATGEGEGGSGEAVYSEGAGIGIGDNKTISFNYGTALALKDSDNTIGLAYDEKVFGINPPAEGNSTGLTLLVSKRGGLEVNASGEASSLGLKVKHDGSLGVSAERATEGTLGVRISTNLKLTEDGIALKLGTDTEKSVCRGLENDDTHGIGIACGGGLAVNDEEQVEVAINNEADALSFNPLFVNEGDKLDMRLHQDDFTFEENSKNIRINPTAFEKATSRIKLGTALKYDEENGQIDMTPVAPLSADRGNVSLQYGTGLYVEDGKLCSNGGSQGAYSPGSGISIDEDTNRISVICGTAIDIGKGYSVGVKYDQAMFSVNSVSAGIDRVGLTLKLSTNGGLQAVNSGDIQGLGIDCGPSMMVYKNKLDIIPSTNIKVTESGIALKLGTDTEKSVCRGLENSEVHGIGIACGTGLKIGDDGKLQSLTTYIQGVGIHLTNAGSYTWIQAKGDGKSITANNGSIELILAKEAENQQTTESLPNPLRIGSGLTMRLATGLTVSKDGELCVDIEGLKKALGL